MPFQSGVGDLLANMSHLLAITAPSLKSILKQLVSEVKKILLEHPSDFVSLYLNIEPVLKAHD
jgi:hypothetical protein